MSRRTLFLLSPLVVATCLATDALGAQRAFVRSNGVDTGICTLTAPCRTLTYAMTQVDAAGEIVALDAAGYGAVTIDKSVTIATNSGFFAGISASTGNAITIATGGVHVVLRGLNVNGLGATTGIQMTSGSSLTVENCVVSNFSGNGIEVNTPADVRILDTTVRGNGADGIRVMGGAFATLNSVRMSNNAGSGLSVRDGGDVTTIATVTDSDASDNSSNGFGATTVSIGTARLSIRESTASGNFYGVYSGAAVSAQVSIGNSSVVGNTVGLANTSAMMETYGNNLIRYNTTATTGTIIPVGGQ